jgi:hypothetical protein
LPVVHAARPRAGLRLAAHAAAHRRRAACEGADVVGPRGAGRRGASPGHRLGARAASCCSARRRSPQASRRPRRWR